MKYPETPRGATVDVYHGTSVADPYRALEDLDAPETAAWVEAQNALSVPFLEALPRRSELIERFTRLWSWERYSPPEKHGSRYFFRYDDGKRDHAVLMVADDLAEKARVLLDPNGFSKDRTSSLSRYKVSPDGALIAYAISEGGSDWRHWRVRDVATGQDRMDRIEHTKFTDVSWTPDGSAFYYSRYPTGSDGKADDRQQVTLYRHVLGESQAEDTEIYRVKEHPTRNAYGRVTSDGQTLIVTITDGYLANDIYTMSLTSTCGTVREVLNRWDARYDFLGSRDDVLFLRTTQGAPNGRVVAVTMADSAPERWRVVVPESPMALTGASYIGGRIVARYLRDARAEVQIYDALNGKLERTVALPGPGSVWGMEGDSAADATETFFAFESFTAPDTVYRLDVSTGATELFRDVRVDANLADFETSQVFFTSKDGTRVPMFLLHKKGLKPDGQQRVLLYGYGGFDISLTPNYKPRWIAWLELGGVVAIANLRGGGEYGKAWHQAGTRLEKQNTFDDFFAARQWLVDQGWSKTEFIAASGRSNGGLLIGATMTQQPAAFGATGPAVGVLDMLRYHTASANARQWSSDYGLSENEKEFKAQHAFSPVHNTKPGTCYPPTLINTADHDDRVVPWHSYKFAAALQHAQSCDSPILLRVETRAGHGAGKPKWMRIEEAADRWAFMAWAIGLDRP